MVNGLSLFKERFQSFNDCYKFWATLLPQFDRQCLSNLMSHFTLLVAPTIPQTWGGMHQHRRVGRWS